MQTIMSTFLAYAGPFASRGIYDPFANIYAALNYARSRYGPGLMSGGMGIGSGHGYANGGVISEHIVGFGRSGQMYQFGEHGDETVIPGRVHAGGGGNTYNISVNVHPLGHPAETGREVVAAIKAFEARSGKKWRS